MSFKLVESQREYLSHEQGYYIYPLGSRNRMALVYPNLYKVGMSNLGFHIIYDIMNRRTDTACERFFLPEKKLIKEYERTNTPIMSIETQSYLCDFPLIAFDISFEIDYFNVLDIMELSRVTLKAAERKENDPIVIAGGPCSTFNPEPLSPFIDAFIIGEGENTMMYFMDVLYDSKTKKISRADTLKALSKIDGVYVPSLYSVEYKSDGIIKSIELRDKISKKFVDNSERDITSAKADIFPKIKRQWIENIDDYPAHTVVVTSDTEFNMYLIETARGCGRHCRFCMAGYCYRRPRNRSLEELKKCIAEAKKFNKRIGLMGAAISDYPQIDELCDYIIDEGMKMSVASFRADSVSEKLVRALKKSGTRTLTLAPEAGNDKMRAVINKGIDEKHLFHAMDIGMAAGIHHYRLYIMIGLPFETFEDIESICELAVRIKEYIGKKGALTLSVNPFIPKPFTPFQWLPMENKKNIEKKYKMIHDLLKNEKSIELLTEPLRSSYVQGVLARGDRRVGEALHEAHKNGGAKGFRTALKSVGLDEDFYLYRERGEDEIMPWDILDMHVKREYLISELEKAKKGQSTMRCFDNCHRCGVC